MQIRDHEVGAHGRQTGDALAVERERDHMARLKLRLEPDARRHRGGIQEDFVWLGTPDLAERSRSVPAAAAFAFGRDAVAEAVGGTEEIVGAGFTSSSFACWMRLVAVVHDTPFVRPLVHSGGERRGRSQSQRGGGERHERQ